MGKYWGEHNWNNNLPIGQYPTANSLKKLNFMGFKYCKCEVKPGLWVTDDLRPLKNGDKVYFEDTDNVGVVYGSHHGNIDCCGYFIMPEDESFVGQRSYGQGTTLKDVAGTGYRVL